MTFSIIKFCGMREPQNIEALSKLPQITHLGAIFYPPSPRYVRSSPLSAKSFRTCEKTIVGVFVNPTLDEIKEAIDEYELSHIQLHGKESPAFCKEVSLIRPVWKAFGVSESFDFSQLDQYANAVELFVFDTFCKEHGGSGRKFNWEILQNRSIPRPFLLSGGIRPDDEESLLAFVHPQYVGIDCNSGFESEPGVKDASSVEKFLRVIG